MSSGPPDEGLGVLGEGAVGVSARSGQEVPVSNEQVGILSSASHELLEARRPRRTRDPRGWRTGSSPPRRRSPRDPPGWPARSSAGRGRRSPPLWGPRPLLPAKPRAGRAAPAAPRSRGAPPRGRGAPTPHARSKASARASSGLSSGPDGTPAPGRRRRHRGRLGLARPGAPEQIERLRVGPLGQGRDRLVEAPLVDERPRLRQRVGGHAGPFRPAPAAGQQEQRGGRRPQSPRCHGPGAAPPPARRSFSIARLARSATFELGSARRGVSRGGAPVSPSCARTSHSAPRTSGSRSFRYG